MGLEPGYLVSKHVKLVRMLKRGGMGSVWIADHTALQTQVAVKFMSGGTADDPAMVTRFVREATSAAQIKSPHVVQVHDHGITPEGEPFIVMELLEGEDLASRMKRLGPLAIEEVAKIVLQTCRVLGKAHQMGIIHRDIKPSNIFLVDTEGDIFIKVLDFGVAKLRGEESEITTTGAMVGTVVYMSPEQLLSARRVDHRSDLWSLAVLAYRAITGELPFKDDEGIGALCRALEAGIFFPPSEFDAGLPKDIDAWFERAFQREPSRRFDSAREFIEEFFLAIGMAQALSPPSTPGVSPIASRETLNSRRYELTATAQSVRMERSIHAERATRAEKSTRGAPPVDSLPMDILSQDFAPSRAAAAGAMKKASTAAEEPGSMGGAPALTLTGSASRSPMVQRRSVGRRLLFAGVTLSAVAILGIGGARFFGVPLPWPGSSSIEPITGDPGALSVAPATAPLVSAAPSALVIPGPTVAVSAAPMASVAASVAPTGSALVSASPLASGVPSVLGSARFPGRQGGFSRPNKPEKDYGF
jgi:serine/threonine protein kinase